MKAFTLGLLALCTIQIAIALPRPDFGINAPVYGSADVGLTATNTGTLVDKVNDNLDVLLSSGYPLLTTVKGQLIGIANDFTTKGLAVTGAIEALAASTGPLEGAFGGFTTASTNLIQLANTGLNGYYTVLEANLDNSITTMVRDAVTDVTDVLTALGGLLTTLKSQLQMAVNAAGSTAPSKAIQRKYVSTTLTSTIAKKVISLKALIPLVTYIASSSIANVKIADNYIIEAGTVAEGALDEVGKGLEALEAEIQLYSGDADQITNIIAPVATPNLDMSGVDMTGVPLIDSEINEFKQTYTTELASTIVAIKAKYDQYKQAVPAISDGLGAFYSASACGHLQRLVLVLVSNGKYADYCYAKYSPRTFALFYEQARETGRCVDLEITRLLKLQEVLLAIAKLLVFSVEDVLANVKLCVQTPAQCNVDSIELAFHGVHQAVQAHQTTMQNIVRAETVAGLQRVSACFSTSKYLLVIATKAMMTEIDSCAADGPNAA